MNLIDWSVRHPRPIYFCTLLCGLAALFCLAWKLPIQALAQAPSTTWAVVTQCPNLSPEQVEARVTIPLEQALLARGRTLTLRSQSMHAQSVLLCDGLTPQELAQCLPNLPWPSRVLAYRPLAAPFLRFALRAPNWSPARTRDWIQQRLLPTLQACPGVESVRPFGGQLQWEFTPQQWESVQKGNALPVEVGRLSRPHDGPLYRYNGDEAIEIRVDLREDASAPFTRAEVHRRLTRMLRQETPGIQIEEAYNGVALVQDMLTHFWFEMGLGLVLTAGVVYAFFRHGGATLVVLISVPTALSLTLVVMATLGLGLNSSSLIGLLLCLGRVVDDTIIDLSALMQSQPLPEESASQRVVRCCSRARSSVVWSTLLGGLAVCPLLVSGGLTEAMFRAICIPYLAGLGASLLVSLTLTPVLMTRLRFPSPSQGWEGRYRSLLGFLSRSRAAWLASAAGLVYLGLLCYPLIGAEMMPLADTGRIDGLLEAAPGTSARETASMVEKLEQILRRQPEVTTVSSEIGMETRPAFLTGYEPCGPSSARLTITLLPKNRRQRDLWALCEAVRGQALLAIPEARRISLKEMGSDLMASAMAPVELVLRGPNRLRLGWLSQPMVDLGLQIPGLYQVSSSWNRSARRLTPYQKPSQLRMLENETRQGWPVALLEPRPPSGEFLQDFIERDGGQPSISVMGTIHPGGPGSMPLAMRWAMEAHHSLPIPPGYELLQRGDMQAMMDSFQRLGWSMAVALAAMYLALCWRLASLTRPLLILLSVPFQVSGAALALALAHQTFSTASLLGLAVVQGMSTTVFVLLFDAMAEHGPIQGAVLRARPILMTSLITVVVMAGLLWFPGSGLDAYASLALTVLGGLVSSTTMGMVIFPLCTMQESCRIQPE